MHMRAAMLIVLAVVFAAGTAFFPTTVSRTVTAADESSGLARAAALRLQLSQAKMAEPSVARYQSAATALTGQTVTAADFVDSAERYELLFESLASEGLAVPAPLAVGEAAGRFEAVAEVLADRGRQATGLQALDVDDATARYQSAAAAFAARSMAARQAADDVGARYEAVSGMLTSREVAAAAVASVGRAVAPGKAAAMLAMVPLTEHEDNGANGDSDGGDGGDGGGETFESPNYDYAITFDDSVWNVVDESEQEDDAGNPFEVLRLQSDAAFATFYGLTADFNDTEDCVEELEDFVSGIDGIDDVEERDDIAGDDEDSSVVIDYVYEPEGEDETEWASFLRCQVIEEDEVFLMTWYDALRDDFDDDEDARKELLDGVEVGEGDNDGGDGGDGDGETFESPNYDYAITFDDSVWNVVDESEQEDDAGNPFEVLQLSSTFGIATFYGLTADFSDAEDCVEGLEDFVAGIDGIDDVEERDDIAGDDEDSSVVIDYVFEPEDGDEQEWSSLLLCQVIEEDEVFLMTWYDALRDDFDDDEDAREELLDGVEIG